MPEAKTRDPEASLITVSEFAFGATLRDFSSPRLVAYEGNCKIATFEMTRGGVLLIAPRDSNYVQYGRCMSREK